MIVQEIPEVQVFERIQDQIVPERIEEQAGDIPVPPIVEETVEMVQMIPQELFPERVDERIVDFPVPVIVGEIPDGVSSSRGVAHAAPAPVNEFLASVIEYVSSSSSAAHAAPTSTDSIFEQVTHICERIEKETEKEDCDACQTLRGRAAPARRTLNKFLRNAADELDTPLCLGSWRVLFTWSQTRGHLRGPPNLEGTMVWTEYVVASCGRELGIPRPSLGCQPDARGERIFILGDPHRRVAAP